MGDAEPQGSVPADRTPPAPRLAGRRKTNKLALHRRQAGAHSTIRHPSRRCRRTVATNFLRSDNVRKSRRDGNVGERPTDRANAVKRSCLANGRRRALSTAPRFRDNSWELRATNYCYCWWEGPTLCSPPRLRPDPPQVYGAWQSTHDCGNVRDRQRPVCFPKSAAFLSVFSHTPGVTRNEICRLKLQLTIIWY